MTTVAILPVQTDSGLAYLAVAGDRQSQGTTAGEALDALTAQLPEKETGTLVIVQSRRPDEFFTAAQQQRLGELMARWRTLRDQNQVLLASEQSELDVLVEAELRASAARASAMADGLAR